VPFLKALGTHRILARVLRVSVVPLTAFYILHTACVHDAQILRYFREDTILKAELVLKNWTAQSSRFFNFLWPLNRSHPHQLVRQVKRLKISA